MLRFSLKLDFCWKKKKAVCPTILLEWLHFSNERKKKRKRERFALFNSICFFVVDRFRNGLSFFFAGWRHVYVKMFCLFFFSLSLPHPSFFSKMKKEECCFIPILSATVSFNWAAVVESSTVNAFHWSSIKWTRTTFFDWTKVKNKKRSWEKKRKYKILKKRKRKKLERREKSF